MAIIMVYHGLSRFIMACHGLSWFVIHPPGHRLSFARMCFGDRCRGLLCHRKLAQIQFSPSYKHDVSRAEVTERDCSARGVYMCNLHVFAKAGGV
jgi:hypothetical protein